MLRDGASQQESIETWIQINFRADPLRCPADLRVPLDKSAFDPNQARNPGLQLVCSAGKYESMQGTCGKRGASTRPTMTHVSIAAGSQISADAGAVVADLGGNAVDAVIAAAIVSMCTDTGIMAPGAGGFVTVWPADGEPVVLDGYAEIPGRGLPPGRLGQGATEVQFDYGGGMRTLVGYGSVATPGAFASLASASRRFGSMPWAQVLAPGIRWARTGFPLSGAAAVYLSHTHEAIFSWHPDSYRILHHRDGTPLREGERVHVPDLADTLSLIAEQGAGTLYGGPLGRRIARGVQANGGLLTEADLDAYRSEVRAPIRVRLDGWEVATNPPPAVGGACMAAMLLLLDRQPIERWNPAEAARMVEVQHAVLDYRARCLDGATRDMPRAAAGLLERAGLGQAGALLQSPSTVHVSAVDGDGLACAATMSSGYGSGAMVEGTGFWLNNSLGEVDLHPKGLQGLPPGTRLSSNMAPTIARRDDGAVLAIGSPGASRITTAIVAALVNFVEVGMPLSEAVAHPRLHVEMFDQAWTVATEPGLPLQPMNGFRIRAFDALHMYFGGVQAALRHADGSTEAVADPRRAGGIAEGGRSASRAAGLEDGDGDLAAPHHVLRH